MPSFIRSDEELAQTGLIIRPERVKTLIPRLKLSNRMAIKIVDFHICSVMTYYAVDVNSCVTQTHPIELKLTFMNSFGRKMITNFIIHSKDASRNKRTITKVFPFLATRLINIHTNQRQIWGNLYSESRGLTLKT